MSGHVQRGLNYSSRAGRPPTQHVAKCFPKVPNMETISEITAGHARFWGETEGRFRSPRLPELSPRRSGATMDGGALKTTRTETMSRLLKEPLPSSYVGASGNSGGHVTPRRARAFNF